MLHAPIAAMMLEYGEVVEVDDPQGSYRVRVRLHGYSGAANQDSEIWARVAAPFAGAGHGAVMLPGVGHQVVVGFVSVDRSYPVVLGALYHGEAQPADEPVEGGAVKRWSLKGAGGTHVLLDESRSSEIVLETSGGVRVTVSDEGTRAEVTDGSSTVTVDPAGVSVRTGAQVKVDAATVEVNSGSVTVNAAVSNFSGVVRCDVLQTNTVVSTTYTPGAGNIW